MRDYEQISKQTSVWPLPCPRCGEETANGWEMGEHLKRAHELAKGDAATETFAALRLAQAAAAVREP